MTGLSGLEGCKVKVTPIQLLSDHHHTFIMIIASVPSLVVQTTGRQTDLHYVDYDYCGGQWSRVMRKLL